MTVYKNVSSIYFHIHNFPRNTFKNPNAIFHYHITSHCKNNFQKDTSEQLVSLTNHGPESSNELVQAI